MGRRLPTPASHGCVYFPRKTSHDLNYFVYWHVNATGAEAVAALFSVLSLRPSAVPGTEGHSSGGRVIEWVISFNFVSGSSSVEQGA